MSPNAGDTQGKYVTGVDVTNGVIMITYGGTEVERARSPTQTLELVAVRDGRQFGRVAVRRRAAPRKATSA